MKFAEFPDHILIDYDVNVAVRIRHETLEHLLILFDDSSVFIEHRYADCEFLQNTAESSLARVSVYLLVSTLDLESDQTSENYILSQ